MTEPTHPPLLSSKPISEYSSDEYAEYVRSLYVPPAPKKAAGPKKERIPGVKKPPKLTFALTKKGLLSVRGRRKWVTDSELCAAAASLGLKQRVVWLALKEKGIKAVRTEAEGLAQETQNQEQTDELPW